MLYSDSRRLISSESFDFTAASKITAVLALNSSERVASDSTKAFKSSLKSLLNSIDSACGAAGFVAAGITAFSPPSLSPLRFLALGPFSSAASTEATDCASAFFGS